MVFIRTSIASGKTTEIQASFEFVMAGFYNLKEVNDVFLRVTQRSGQVFKAL